MISVLLFQQALRTVDSLYLRAYYNCAGIEYDDC